MRATAKAIVINTRSHGVVNALLKSPINAYLIIAVDRPRSANPLNIGG
jgi:hypothetical protein